MGCKSPWGSTGVAQVEGLGTNPKKLEVFYIIEIAFVM